jgi:hypothetical protein
VCGFKTNKDYWELLIGSHVKGVLGLFHFLQRLVRTLRVDHDDHKESVAKLCRCVYRWEDTDLNNLLEAINSGHFPSFKKMSEGEMQQFMVSKKFKDNYQQYLRKNIYPPSVIQSYLDAWFRRYACSSSNPDLNPSSGRRDSVTDKTLYTRDTKKTYLECRKKCMYLQDPFELALMYQEIPASLRSKHGLSKWKSLRGESNLESWHGEAAHYGNTAMRTETADAVMHLGTARNNVRVRRKLLPKRGDRYMEHIPGAYQDIPESLTTRSWITSTNLQRMLEPSNFLIQM